MPDSTATPAMNTSPTEPSILSAMTTAPTTMNGDLRNRRRNIFTPFCTRLMSLVRRVISVEVPTVSSTEQDIPFTRAYRSRRRPAAVPTAARAAKY